MTVKIKIPYILFSFFVTYTVYIAFVSLLSLLIKASDKCLYIYWTSYIHTYIYEYKQLFTKYK